MRLLLISLILVFPLVAALPASEQKPRQQRNQPPSIDSFSYPGTTVIATSLPLVAIAYQAINFHHYVVDAVIWKVRRKPVQQNFGIAK